MMFLLSALRKKVAFGLLGVSMVSGISMLLSSGVDAQDVNPLQWRTRPSQEQGAAPGALVLMGQTLAPMSPLLAVTSSKAPPAIMVSSVPASAIVEKPEHVPDLTPVKHPGEGWEASTKTIAIDAEPSNGEAPLLRDMDSLQFAAQMWSNASFPVEHFQAYTSPFGYRSSPTGGYREEFHYGLDIAAPQASYIRNWWAGTVIEVSDGGSCGTSVVIQSGEWTHMYCHMQGHVEINRGIPSLIDREGGVQLWEGQQIGAGDRIGRVGMTGRTTGPHLHWGLKYQGNWVDPAWVLQAMAASYQALYGQN